MPWPRWEVRARHADKKFHKSDEFSQDLLEETVEFFALILKNFFDSSKDYYKKDADQRNRHDNVLKNKTAVVSYDFGLKRRGLEIDRYTDSSRKSTKAADTIHKFLTDANSAFSSVQRGIEDGTADAVATHFEAAPKESKTRTSSQELLKTATEVNKCGGTRTLQCRLWAGRCRPTWPRPTLSFNAAGATYKSEALDSFDNNVLPLCLRDSEGGRQSFGRVEQRVLVGILLS
eukprot:s6009_g2.t1